MNRIKSKNQRVERRAKRVRVKVSGTASRPRLSVYRSLSHIYAQLIDDVVGVTIVSAKDADVKAGKTGVEKAFEVGKLLAERAKAAKISEAVFDRGSFKYHGRVKAIAEGAREGGIKI